MKDDKNKGRAPVDPAKLAELAKSAHKAVAEQAAAFEEERKAEVKLLEEVIRLALPGLPSICSKVQGWPMPCVQVATPQLMLNEDGTFAALESTPEVPKPSPFLLTIVEVIETWDPAEIVEALASLFQKQIEGRAGSTAKARERSAKLNALALLIGEI